MATKILSDIHNDLKLLITAITGFEDSDEGFRICERFVLSNIKHHRYLSVDSHATKRTIEEVTKKFYIHGKYEVAKKFGHLVNSFLTSFDFEHHPQYDLQWSLLSLLLNLSRETNNSDLKSLGTSGFDYTLNLTASNERTVPDEIDWGEYLKEGQENFFADYDSSSESEWSDIDEEPGSAGNLQEEVDPPEIEPVVSLLPVKRTPSTSDKLSQYLAEEVESRNWLKNNVQNTWWNEIEWGNCKTNSQFPAAYLCSIWNRSDLSGPNYVSTLSEYQACREILWMFHAPNQMVVFKKSNETNFAVRENISIPSLTPNAFSSILSVYCEFYRMIGEIEDFGKSLYERYDSTNLNKLPPIIYEEYNAALVEHLVELRMGVVDIEKKIARQEDCNTFLTLSRDLEKYMKSVKMIYEIHRVVTIDWKEAPNWKCATYLLSGLYQQVQNSNNRERTNVCASLYLSSLRVYLNIIATWLSEGRLEDWRHEFLIASVPKIARCSPIPERVVYEEQKSDNLMIHPLDEACLTDPVINLMCRKLRHMGRSVELLITLDRMSDMWKMNAERDSVRISLNDEFLNAVMLEFSKYNFTDSADTTDAKVPVAIAECARKPVDVDVDDNIMQQMMKMDNPFLMKAFEEHLPMALYPQRDDVDAFERERAPKVRWGRSIFRELEDISATAILPFRKVLESALANVLDQRYSCASKLVKDILVGEYKLEDHLKLMRCIYMMERGHVMTQFYQRMFNEIESSSTWSNANSLTCILQEVLSQEWQDSSARWSITVEDVRTHQVLQAVDRVTLHYTIGWPVNMVLNDEVLEKYNAVFRFQLKLKWALWTLNNLRFSELEEKDAKAMQDRIQHSYARRLESLRFWLMHAIGSIHAYLAGQVLQGFGIALEKGLAHADNLDTIITVDKVLRRAQYMPRCVQSQRIIRNGNDLAFAISQNVIVHNDYLEKVHEHCLQTSDFEDLMVTIHNLLSMCVHVRERWERGASALVEFDLALMEAIYTKYHTYIALALHNAVQHRDADYYKLTPSARGCMEHVDNSENTDGANEACVTELSRNLLTEVAHQSLPPSGIPIPVPTLVQKRSNNWIDNGVEPQLPEYLSLNQYDQMFSYIRWYHYEEHFLALSHSPRDLRLELVQFINESDAGNAGKQ